MRGDPIPTLADPEVLELLREEPELLAIADAIRATQKQPRRNWRPPRAGLLPMAAVAAATLVVLALLPFRADDAGILERALAAVGTKPVIHLVASTESEEDTLVDLATGRKQPTSIEVETWIDRRTSLRKTITRRNGVVVAESVARGGVVQEPAIELFLSGYRSALAEGTARLAGEGTLEGRAVSFVEVQVPSGTVEVVLDHETYVPLHFRFRRDSDDHVGPRWRVLDLETRAPGEVSFTEVSAPRSPSAGTVVASTPIDPERASRVLGSAAQWLGQRFDGLELETINLQELRRSFADGTNEVSQGLELRYGGESLRSLVRIRIAARPEPAYGFAEGRLTFNFNPIPAAGVADVVRQAGATTAWFGQLRSNDAFVTIEAPSAAAVLHTARELRPIVRSS